MVTSQNSLQESQLSLMMMIVCELKMVRTWSFRWSKDNVFKVSPKYKSLCLKRTVGKSTYTMAFHKCTVNTLSLAKPPRWVCAQHFSHRHQNPNSDDSERISRNCTCPCFVLWPNKFLCLNNLSPWDEGALNFLFTPYSSDHFLDRTTKTAFCRVGELLTFGPWYNLQPAVVSVTAEVVVSV